MFGITTSTCSTSRYSQVRQARIHSLEATGSRRDQSGVPGLHSMFVSSAHNDRNYGGYIVVVTLRSFQQVRLSKVDHLFLSQRL